MMILYDDMIVMIIVFVIDDQVLVEAAAALLKSHGRVSDETCAHKQRQMFPIHCLFYFSIIL